MCTRYLVLCLATVCLASCSAQLRFDSQYVSDESPFLVSRLTLSSNGNFVETVTDKKGHVFSIASTWRRENDGIIFDDFLFAVDLNKHQWVQEPIKVGYPILVIGSSCLTVDPDIGYIFFAE